MDLLNFGMKLPIFNSILKKSFASKSTKKTEFLGMQFPNRIGLAAGFDKNAKWLHLLKTLGFGHVEVGTVTPLAQPGNPAPRLFRLKRDKALINRMGFNNEGLDAMVKRLKSRPDGLIVGGNIGKNKITPNEDAWKDYEKCFLALHDYVDYFVVNVSSPNTPGLRELQEKESLRKILVHLQTLNSEKAIQRPILLKIAPDLTNEQLDDVAALALEIKLDGLVATNTTISRERLSQESGVVSRETGGLSGKPLQQRSTEVLQYLISRTGGNIPVIASGGIFTGADAKEKLNCGAPLVQVWTGFIYEGPAIVKNICRHLVS